MNVMETKYTGLHSKYEYEHLIIYCLSTKGKTETWYVKSKHGNTLGVIKWYNSWRQYCFFPVQDTVFNPPCLKQITHITERLTTYHRAMCEMKRNKKKKGVE